MHYWVPNKRSHGLLIFDFFQEDKEIELVSKKYLKKEKKSSSKEEIDGYTMWK